MDKNVTWLMDRANIETTILKYATAADLRDWDLYQSIFAPEIDIDFSSFGNGPVARIKQKTYLHKCWV